MVNYIPNSGDVVWLDFDTQRGHEQTGRRPALVISPQSYNQKSGLMLACPITSHVKGYPFEVRIVTKKINGAILADQVKSLDWRFREISFAEKAPAAVLPGAQDLIASLVRGR